MHKTKNHSEKSFSKHIFFIYFQIDKSGINKIYSKKYALKIFQRKHLKVF